MEIFNFEQGSAEWHEIRRGVITGTRLGKVMGGPAARKTLIYELIGEEMSDFDPQVAMSKKSYAMAHWNDAEAVIKKEFINDEFTEVGFVKKCAWIGLSPDALLKVWDDFVKGFEIKAPEPTNYIRYVIEGKIPDEYIWQVVHYFVCISKLQSLDFIIFNENMKVKECRSHTFKVTREMLSDRIAEAEKGLSSFRIEWESAKKGLLLAFK